MHCGEVEARTSPLFVRILAHLIIASHKHCKLYYCMYGLSSTGYWHGTVRVELEHALGGKAPSLGLVNCCCFSTLRKAFNQESHSQGLQTREFAVEEFFRRYKHVQDCRFRLCSLAFRWDLMHTISYGAEYKIAMDPSFRPNILQ
jgi:hypothetical protein